MSGEGDMLCPNCGNENRSARPFCSKCGTRLAGVCSKCGAANEADDQFCGDCGSPLATQAPATVEEATRARGAAEAERRLVSVLFADLVGFTALFEDRDAEEVRELLSKYFDLCRRLIARYGASWRSSSATPSWPCREHRPPRRTMPNVRSAQRWSSALPLPHWERRW